MNDEERWLRTTALQAATAITPNNSESYTRHLFVLYRAQKFYEWLEDKNMKCAEWPGNPEERTAEVLKIFDALNERLVKVEEKDD
jgi:plasmid rolling circle replication initiator protein Rep